MRAAKMASLRRTASISVVGAAGTVAACIAGYPRQNRLGRACQASYQPDVHQFGQPACLPNVTRQAVENHQIFADYPARGKEGPSASSERWGNAHPQATRRVCSELRTTSSSSFVSGAPDCPAATCRRFSPEVEVCAPPAAKAVVGQLLAQRRLARTGRTDQKHCR